MNPYPFAPPPAPPTTQSSTNIQDGRGGFGGRGGRGGFGNRRGRGGHSAGAHSTFTSHNQSSQMSYPSTQYPTAAGANGITGAYSASNPSYSNGYNSWTPGSAVTTPSHPQYPHNQTPAQSYYNTYGQPAIPNATQNYAQPAAYGHNPTYGHAHPQSSYTAGQAVSYPPAVPQYQTSAFNSSFPSSNQRSSHGQNRGGGSGNFNPRANKSFPHSFPGQKRKREAEQSPHGGNNGRAGSAAHPNNPSNSKRGRSDRVKVQAPPSVPSFGFAGLPKKPEASAFPSHQPSKRSKNKNKKRKTNQLGLTPMTDLHEDSEDDLEDEEAAFAQSGLPPSIQFGGQCVSLTLPAEIKAWIADRRKNFPTQARIAQRKAAQKAVMSKSRQEPSRRNVQPEPKPFDSESLAEKQRLKMEKLLKKADKLRQKLLGDVASNFIPESQSNADVKSDSNIVPEASVGAANDGTLEDGQQTAGEVVGNLSDTNLASSSSDSSSDSEDDSDTSSDDELPETISAKVPVPSEQADRVRTKKPPAINLPCKYFLRDGHCRRRDCRFSHEIEQADRRLTLFERLTQEERHREQVNALNLIKSLGESGFFDETQEPN